VVEAIQALRGVELTGAVIVIAELGDLTRFDNPRQLMSYLGLTQGLTPSEYSSGERRRQGGITKAGNTHALRALVERAWAYRYPTKVRRHIQLRVETLPAEVKAIGWKAQVRPCKRYRHLTARGKHANLISTLGISRGAERRQLDAGVGRHVCWQAMTKRPKSTAAGRASREPRVPVIAE